MKSKSKRKRGKKGKKDKFNDDLSYHKVSIYRMEINSMQHMKGITGVIPTKKYFVTKTKLTKGN